MLCPGGNEVNAGGLDGTMTQHIGQLYYVPAYPVKGPCEQVAQVVGEDLAGSYARLFAQALHLRPNLPPGQTPSASGEENLARGDFLRLGVLFQFPAQLSGQQNSAQLAFQGNLCPPRPGGLHGDILHLAHPDARGAYCLQQQGQPLPAQAVGGVQQALILLPDELLPVIPEQLPLEL